MPVRFIYIYLFKVVSVAQKEGDKQEQAPSQGRPARCKSLGMPMTDMVGLEKQMSTSFPMIYRMGLIAAGLGAAVVASWLVCVACIIQMSCEFLSQMRFSFTHIFVTLRIVGHEF